MKTDLSKYRKLPDLHYRYGTTACSLKQPTITETNIFSLIQNLKQPAITVPQEIMMQSADISNNSHAMRREYLRI